MFQVKVVYLNDIYIYIMCQLY